jgi:hypothetical protein
MNDVGSLIEEKRQLKKSSDEQFEQIHAQIAVKTKEFQQRYAKAVTEASVHAYLEQHGFTRVTDVPWTKDVFRSTRRYLARNPVYMSEDGYVFGRMLFGNEQCCEPYQLIKLKDKKKVAYELNENPFKHFFLPLGLALSATAFGIEKFGTDTAWISLLLASGIGIAYSTANRLFCHGGTETMAGSFNESVEKLVDIVKDKK